MAEKQTPTVKVYVVHCYHEDSPLAVFRERSDAWDLCCEHPRSFIHELEIPLSRWFSVEEYGGRKSD